MVFIPTVSVTRPSQLEVGAYYLIKGTDNYSKLPLPPQVIRVEEIFHNPMALDGGYLTGTLWWRMWHTERVVHHHILPLKQINLPEQGKSDIHLERIPNHIVRDIVGNEAFGDVQQELLKKFSRNGKSKRSFTLHWG